MRVCIVDDHEVVREGLRSVLEKDGSIAVVCEAGTGAEALAVVAAERPDAVVVDFRLPDITGDELCRALTTAHPGLHVIVFTTYLSEDLVRLTLAAGAAAFVTKAAGIDELRAVLARIDREGENFQRSSASATVHRLFGASGGEEHHVLTPRQEAVVQLAADGFTYAEIASQLMISQSTVRFHIQAVKERLGARSKTELISIAIRRALIAPAAHAVR
ncbi:response regulator transcription factor [soil metagenome]